MLPMTEELPVRRLPEIRELKDVELLFDCKATRIKQTTGTTKLRAKGMLFF